MKKSNTPMERWRPTAGGCGDELGLESPAAVGVDDVDRHPHVLGVGRHLDQREPHRVRAVAHHQAGHGRQVAVGSAQVFAGFGRRHDRDREVVDLVAQAGGINDVLEHRCQRHVAQAQFVDPQGAGILAEAEATEDLPVGGDDTTTNPAVADTVLDDDETAETLAAATEDAAELEAAGEREDG